MNALAQQIQAEFYRRLHYRRDRIPGGLGDKAKVQDFDREQVAKGIRVEMEHTSDPRVALEITLDHLSESPTYYDELGKLKLSRMLSAEFARRRQVYGKFVEGEHPRDEEGKFTAHGTDSPEFKKWFSGSKVSDDSGRPIKVFHGTGNKDFAELRPSSNDRGIYLTPDRSYAEGYADVSKSANAGVVQAFVSLKNPAVVFVKDTPTLSQEQIDSYKAQGHDGLLVAPNWNPFASGTSDIPRMEDVEEIVVFDSDQVRRTGD